MVKKNYSLSERISIANQFDIEGEIYMVTPYGGGHINDTYSIESKIPSKLGYSMKRFILQRIDTNIFIKPIQVMENIQKVTEKQHLNILARNGNPLREAITIINTKNGKPYLEKSDDNTFWRCYHFIENARTYDFIPDNSFGLNLAYQAGLIFGKFQLQLVELPGKKLHETINKFHHTPYRIQQLEDAIKMNNKERLNKCKEEIKFARSLYDISSTLINLMEEGKIPIRVSHNDTKINNVMFDYSGEKEKALVIIDLDTVMPGTMLYDFGDLVRTSTWPGAEDEKNPSKVYVSLDLFKALVKGWFESVESIMKPIEISNLPLAGKLITYNMGIRFLADYLKGDQYYNIQYKEQNLDRAKVQFAIIKSIDKKWDEMEKIIKQLQK